MPVMDRRSCDLTVQSRFTSTVCSIPRDDWWCSPALQYFEHLQQHCMQHGKLASTDVFEGALTALHLRLFTCMGRCTRQLAEQKSSDVASVCDGAHLGPLFRANCQRAAP